MHRAVNPYAPPQAPPALAIPDAPEAFGWEIDGDHVWVEKLAQFPMIDPYTGECEDTMALQRIEVRYRPRWLIAIPLCCGLLMAAGQTSAVDVLVFLVIGAGLGWLLARLGCLALPLHTLYLFVLKRTLRLRRTQGIAMTLLFLLILPGGILFSFGPQWMGFITVGAAVAWIIGNLWILLFTRQLYSRRRSGERIAIRGIHPVALEAMRSCNVRANR